MSYKTTFSNRLRIKLQLGGYGLRQAGSTFLSKRNAPARFRNYLFTMHSIIRSSVPLMQAAYHECDLPHGEKLLDQLKKYYKEHITEEMSHDEWLLNDLETIGVSRQDSLIKKTFASSSRDGWKSILLDLSLASGLFTWLYFILRGGSAAKGIDRSTTRNHRIS